MGLSDEVLASMLQGQALTRGLRIELENQFAQIADQPPVKVAVKKAKRVKDLPRHVVIPDTQVKPGVPTIHLEWIGAYIVEQFAGDDLTVIHLGDHWDMPSLSSYDKGKRVAEGRRVVADIIAGNRGFDLLNLPLAAYNKTKRKKWEPRRVFLHGNHEDRITRACNENASLDGLLSLDLLNPAEWGWEVHPFLEVVDIDGIWYCLAPHQRVLMADLTYRKLKHVRVGDEIIAFDEEGQYRHYKKAVVTRADRSRAPLHRVTLANGKTFDATSTHRFLARKRKPSGGASPFEWVTTTELVVGQHELCRPFAEWDHDLSWDAGYLSGIFDGEGCLINAGKQGVQISVAQNEGPVLDNIRRILDAWGVRYNEHKRPTGCVVVHIRGKLRDRIRFLARIRADRLIAKLNPEWLGKMLTHDEENNRVESVAPMGEQEIVELETSSGTLIVEGYAHHNSHYFANPMTGRPYAGMNIETRLKTIGHSFAMGHQQMFLYGVRPVGPRLHHGLVAGSCYLHDEEYRGPQGNSEWRGIVVLNQVENGSYDVMPVSLDYLCRRYEGIRLSEWMERYGDVA